MSFEVSGPLEARGSKKDLEEETSDRSISNFNFCYRMPKKNDDSDEENVLKKEECFSVNFEDREKSSSDHRKSYSKYGKTRQDLYDQLTERSKAELEHIQVYLLDKIDKGEPLPEVTEVCKNLRIMTGAPQMEFDDFEKLRNYNLGISRLGGGMNSLTMPNLPVVVYNNLTSLTMLNVDIATNNMTLKPLFTPKAGEMITCLGVGSSQYQNCVIASCMLQSSLVFIDIQTESVLFYLQLEDASTHGDVTAITTFNKQVVVFFEDWTVRAIDIESAEKIKQFSVPKDLHLEDNALLGVFIDQGHVVMLLNDRILLLNPETTAFEMIIFDLPNESELIFSRSYDNWLVAGCLGQSQLIGVNLNTRKTVSLSIGQAQIVSLGGRINSSEIFVLAESQSGDPTSELTIKQVLIVDLSLAGNQVADRFEVFSESRSLHVLEDCQLVVVEGNQYFNLFSTNDRKLAERIIQGLYSSNQARVEGGTPFLYEQPSTKGNTDASSPIPEQESNQSSGMNSLESNFKPEQIDGLIQLRLASASDNPQVTSESLQEAEQKLAKLIDERLLLFKQNIKNQVLEELKDLINDQIKFTVKEEVATQLSKAGKTHLYTIKVQPDEDKSQLQSKLQSDI